MKCSKLYSIISALLLLLVLSGCGAADKSAKNSISVWCASDTLSQQKAQSLAQAWGSGCSIKVRSFASQAELLGEIERFGPELVICETAAAQNIGVQRTELGFDRLVLLINTEAVKNAGSDAEFGNLEELFSFAEKWTEQNAESFMAIDEPALVMRSALNSLGANFEADTGREKSGGDFRRAYNLLAEALFCGSLRYEQGGTVSALSDGRVACALVRSSQVPDVLPEGWELREVPPMSGGRETKTAIGYSIVLMNDQGQRAEQAEKLMAWLDNSGAEILGFERESSGLEIIAEDCDFMKNHMNFDAEFAKLAKHLSPG